MASAPSQELPAIGGDLAGFWSPLGGPPAPLLPHFPCSYPALPCYSWLHPPPLGLLVQPVSAPCELPSGRPLLWPGPLLRSPLGQPEGPSRAKVAASRESTVALKAWLGRHLKNPYPSKGEKVLLAIVSRMSLTQVSTWFANARRRLKKENRACWAPRPPKEGGAGEEEDEEEDEEEEEEGESEGETGESEADAPGAAQPRTKPPDGSGVAAAAPWPKVQRGHGLPSSATGAGRAESPLAKPKIWCVAEFATRPQPGRAAV